MLVNFVVPLSWSELFRRTAHETLEDNGLDLAAQLAYYFFLALFPALLFFVALASYVPAADVTGRLVASAQGVAPPAIINLLRQQLRAVAENRHGGILTFGIVGALWSSSAAMVALIGAMNRAFDIEEARTWWRQRLTAVLLTIGAALFIIASFTLVVAGPQIGGWLASQAGLGDVFGTVWGIAVWPLAFLLVVTAIGLVYHFAPDVETKWSWLTPGSVLATLLWLAGSIGVRYYVANFGSYQETYGAIGGVIVVLLWLYMSGLVIFIGAEMNSEIAHARQGHVAADTSPAGAGRSQTRQETPSHRPSPMWGLAAAPILIWLWARREH